MASVCALCFGVFGGWLAVGLLGWLRGFVNSVVRLLSLFIWWCLYVLICDFVFCVFWWFGWWIYGVSLFLV